jgi:hypothetical protein
VQGRLQHRLQRAAAGHESHGASRFSGSGQHLWHEGVAQQRVPRHSEGDRAFGRVQ